MTGERRSRLSLSVLIEDEWLLACDKPAGIIVHGDGTGAVTLTDLVREHLLGEGRTDAVKQLQAVQRLDRETTGLVLFSLDKRVQPKLDAAVATHAVHKRYLAVVRGSLPSKPRTIDAPIARDRHVSGRMRVGRTGKPARTRVMPLASHGGLSLVACELETGRRHQIRVHLAHIGHPIVGDVLYGGVCCADGLMLHALQEELDHPVSGRRLVLSTEWPARFEGLFPRRDIDWTVL